jgi:hypothetical protein
MPTATKTGTVPYPWPLGKIVPGATFSTIALPITTNIQPVNADGTPDNMFNYIGIQADLSNALNIYICTSATPDLTNYTNVVGELSAGTWWSRGKEWANNRDISQIFIAAQNSWCSTRSKVTGMKKALFIACVWSGVAAAQPGTNPALLPQCSASRTTNCTPKVNGSGT